MSSGVEASVLVKPSYGLSDDEIAAMLRSGVDHAGDDMACARPARAAGRGRPCRRGHRAGARRTTDTCSPPESAQIRSVIARAARARRAGTDNRAIKAGIDALARVTDTFAARRMDNSIRSALAGHKVDELPI
jgi:molecular chaperone HscA